MLMNQYLELKLETNKQKQKTIYDESCLHFELKIVDQVALMNFIIDHVR